MNTLLVFSLLIAVASAADNGLAMKAPMGWRSWNAFLLDVDQAKMLQQVDALAAPGPNGKSLLDLGFDSIGIDDGWQECGAGVKKSFHDAAGKPLINSTRFPDMLNMNRYAHSKNVKMGWYLNNCWCCEEKSNVGHYEEDVEALFALEFDGIKIDGCGPAHNITKWGELILSYSRPMVIENCADNGPSWTPAKPSQVETCPFHFYRVSSDIAPQFYSTMYNLQATIPFLDQAHPLSRPGCWAYPDMLQVGNNMNLIESRTHFGAWCIVSAPLILGFDLTDKKMYDEVFPLLSNEDAIEVNQAWFGHPGRLVMSSDATFVAPTAHGADCNCCDNLKSCDQVRMHQWQVWAKPLQQGKQAVLLINISENPQDISVTLSALGMKSTVHSYDVWKRAAAADISNEISVKQLQPHDSMFLILTDA